MLDALVEIVLEIFGAVLEEILTPIFSKIRLPKWLKIMSLSLLVIAVMGGLIYGFYYLWNEMGLVGIWVCLAFLAFPFVIWAIVALGICYRFGSLRRAKKEELPQILKLYRSVIGKPGCHWSITYPNEVTLHEDFSTGNLFVLKKGRNIVGAGSIVPENELDDLLCWHYRENPREVARIVINPDFQSKGHGKYLVHQLCRVLRKSGCKSIRLLASTENKRAIRVYQKCGFLSRGSVNRYDHQYYAFERIP